MLALTALALSLLANLVLWLLLREERDMNAALDSALREVAEARRLERERMAENYAREGFSQTRDVRVSGRAH